MPHRQPLLDILDSYTPSNHDEAGELHMFKYFVRENSDCFERSNLIAHVTASSWIVTEDLSYVLLNFHRKLNKWMQFGGHADGDPDIYTVAIKESQEETGLTSLRLFQKEPLDVGLRFLHEHSGVPEHVHLDVCFICIADMNQLLQHSERESERLKWVPLGEVKDYIRPEDNNCQRFLEKTMKLAKLRAA
ncbi:MAG: NUDIX domain-containing protein [Alphaproteobacteria bacterium]|nr:NUDIX domain-containing protein [Alphaproteobacteria bacterium]MDD9920531.1 NUDIX domain-containing protein [Alphaproteobacteria bacterium]